MIPALEALYVVTKIEDHEQRAKAVEAWAKEWVAEVAVEHIVTKGSLAQAKTDQMLNRVASDMKNAVLRAIGDRRETMFYLAKPTDLGLRLSLSLALLLSAPDEPLAEAPAANGEGAPGGVRG